jgi:hypothetical protein
LYPPPLALVHVCKVEPLVTPVIASALNQKTGVAAKIDSAPMENKSAPAKIGLNQRIRFHRKFDFPIEFIIKNVTTETIIFAA